MVPSRKTKGHSICAGRIVLHGFTKQLSTRGPHIAREQHFKYRQPPLCVHPILGGCSTSVLIQETGLVPENCGLAINNQALMGFHGHILEYIAKHCYLFGFRLIRLRMVGIPQECQVKRVNDGKPLGYSYSYNGFHNMFRRTKF